MQQGASVTRATGSVSLSETERVALTARIQQEGEAVVLRALGVSRQTLGRLAGGLTVRKSSAAVARSYIRENADASR